MKDLTLVGYIKGDFMGPERLRKLYDNISPDIVLLDCEDTGYQRSIKNHKHMSRCLGESETKDTCINALGFERWVTEEYAQNHPINKAFIHNIDNFYKMSFYPKEVLNTFSRQEIERRQANIDEFYDKHRIDQVFGVTDDNIYKHINLMDSLMSTKATYIISNNPDSRIMLLGTVLDIFGDHEHNLYDCLKEFLPKRMLLKDADNL